MDTYLDIALDAALDSLKLLPFLFATYFAIEYLEHRASHGLSRALAVTGRWGPLIGAAAGLVPQCGFSVTAANLYCGGLISFGTLLAVFCATSDEAVPVLLSHGGSAVVPALLAVKFIAAALCGALADLIFKKGIGGQKHNSAHSRLHEGCHGDCCEGGIVRTALRHSLRSFLFIFVTMLLLGVAVYLAGDGVIERFVSASRSFQPLLAAAVGLIPGCGSSIILSELYLGGALSFASLSAGLTANTGVGLLFLIRRSGSPKQSLAAVSALVLVSLLTSAAVLALGI